MRDFQILLISGWAHGAESLAPVAEALQGRYSIISTSLYDLLQEDTRSDAPSAADNGPGISPYARAVAARLRQTADRVCLVGWSMGGMVAIEAAAIAPCNVGALLLLGATAHFCSRDGYSCGVPPAALRAMRRALPGNPQTVLRGFFSQAASPGSITGEDLRCKVDRALSFGINSLIHGLDYLQRIDLRESLQTISQPSLIIHGRKDQVVPWSASEFLNRNIVHSTANFLPDVGHMLIVERTEEIVQRMRTFLERLP